MRAEKKYLASEVDGHLDKSDFCILADYHGIKVDETEELRSSLAECGAEFHVVKNSALDIAAKARGMPDMSEFLIGPTAIVVGGRDASGTAKKLKKFHKETEKVGVKAGIFGDRLLTAEQITRLAELPDLDTLRAQLLSLLNSPATGLLSVLSSPARSFVNVLQAKANDH
jgi:large subunit ribosomal protein L10